MSGFRTRRSVSASNSEDVSLEGMTPEVEQERALSICFHKLNARARTEQELRQVLSQAGISDEISDLAIDRLQVVGYLNDREFAEAWIRARVTSRGMAPAAIRRELLSKGVDPDIVDTALSEVSDGDTYARAVELATKKLRSVAALNPSVALRRISSLLLRKGYPSHMAYSVAAAVVGSSEDRFDQMVCDTEVVE